MRCPKCGAESEVVETRPCIGGFVVRRRRRCAERCGNFPTYEIPRPLANELDGELATDLKRFVAALRKLAPLGRSRRRRARVGACVI